MGDLSVYDRLTLPIRREQGALANAIDIRDQSPAYEASTPIRPPTGAPNVVVVLVDDMGFGASSAFGGPC